MNSTIKYTYKDEEVTLDVRNRIGFLEVEEIINSVVDGVIDGGKYYPSRFDYYLYSCILMKYTNFDIDKYTVDEIYELIDDDKFTENLKQVIDRNQYLRIVINAQDIIKVKLNEHPFKSIAQKINALIENGGDIIQNLAKNEEFRNTLMNYVADDKAKNVVRMFDQAIDSDAK